MIGGYLTGTPNLGIGWILALTSGCLKGTPANHFGVLLGDKPL